MRVVTFHACDVRIRSVTPAASPTHSTPSLKRQFLRSSSLLFEEPPPKGFGAEMPEVDDQALQSLAFPAGQGCTYRLPCSALPVVEALKTDRACRAEREVSSGRVFGV